ncbi:porin family protein [Pseudotenacibaculum sp. MALMAid0570]|uniref:porin family protein n=1 Tax=Pseudotenacibaculum sp. MALMAid0570 TaxID=3143938 RepID=UPI0032DEAA5A
MKKTILFFFLVLSISIGNAQKDSLQLGDRYAEDQLYFLIAYDQLFDQPSQVGGSGFSYGLSSGFIKDFILNKRGSVSVGIGIGYSFDSFNHGLKVSEINNAITFEVDNTITSNKLSIHSLEFPLEIRWRDSNANKYSYWRIYTGIKVSYNLSNTFRYNDGAQTFSFKNVSRFNQWQYGLTMSVGYDAFTAHVYYGLTPILKDSSIGTTDISTKIIKIGLIFYLL